MGPGPGLCMAVGGGGGSGRPVGPKAQGGGGPGGAGAGPRLPASPFGKPPGVGAPGAGSRVSVCRWRGWGDQTATCSKKRMRMVATWPRTALPVGLRVVSEVPVTSPVPLAQAMAVWAYPAMSPASV